ncbi:MAG TPA: phosphoribosylanthranilate isomerase [Thermoanaerobaculia bacterium]|nr:phosphoribosylanthranilate isomerase [Thermoanaerobaculia bacterium]
MTTKVKVCGVVDPHNAWTAVSLGADFLGLNFYPRSPRYVGPGRAQEIAEAVRGKAILVGVFVDASPSEIEDTVARVGLDLVQLSGDEEPAPFAHLASRLIKGFRTGGDPGDEALSPWADGWGLLFDAPHESLYGGTGKSWDYDAVSRIMDRLAGRRVFLAGGLGPDNVRQAIAAARPFAVDVCSRVESAPGIKDPELLRRLFEEVRNAQVQDAP